MNDADALTTDSSRIVNQTPFYYGWVILGVGTLGFVMSSPAQSYVLSVFMDSYIYDLGISRLLISSLFAVGTLAGSLAMPYIGRLIDKKGSRVMVTGIALLFGISLIFMALVLNAWMLLFGFVAYRLFGKAALYLVSTNMINQWWVRRRGVMLGLAGFSLAVLSTGASPSLLNWLISQYGWRSSYLISAAALILIMTPVGYLFCRDHPEQYGLNPDGEQRAAQQAGKADQGALIEVNWTLRETLHTPTFWIVGFSLGIGALILTGLFVHLVGIGQDSGLSARMSAAIFLPVGLVSAFVNLGSGVVVDRVQGRFLLLLMLILIVICLLMPLNIPGVEYAILFGIVMGVVLGLLRMLNTVIWAKYYGRRHLGSISGAASLFVLIGTALGPLPMGLVKDLTGSYQLALVTLTILPLTLSLASVFAKQPEYNAKCEAGV